MPDDWSDRRDALPRGCVLRDYTIEEVLGHGGFGIVYKARHNELDHVVAIKEYLPSELAVREGTTVRAKSAECETQFADGLRRFREEGKALIEFQQHPSIVDCREFFRANGTAYLVMEYVEGLPLSELLRQREAAGQPFTESDLLAIATPLAQGLAHIHRAGMVHRDIKPANILVRRSDRRPVLIDFGAAKQAVAEHSRSLAPYTEGYAALGQVADGQLGPWTDLYGFGAVLWRIVAGGNRPWDPPNPVKAEARANARVREADDPLPTAKELGTGRFAKQLLEMIDGCLQLRDTERIRESDRVVQLLGGSGEESHETAMAERQAEGGHDMDRPDPVSEEARAGRSTTSRYWKVVGVAAALAVAVALATVALIPRNGTVETPETPGSWNFSIEAEPETATVALLNGPEAYRPGMPLIPGQYEVIVSAPGFATRREWVDHSESETLHRVALEPLPDAEPESVQAPPDSTLEPPAPTDAEPEEVPIVVSSVSEPIEDEPVATDDREGDATNAESQSTCGVGSFEDCFELGEAYRKGDGVPRDARRAAEFYERACDGGYAPGCHNLGKSYTEGEGVGQDWAQAAELYWRACDGGYAEGCNNLGYLYAEGVGVPLDRARAAGLYERACDGGNAEGCYNLGDYYSEGKGVVQDWVQVAELYRRACRGEVARGCYKLGFLYSEGQGVDQDWAQAAELFRRSCGAGNTPGCYNLGFLYSEGKGVRQDWAQAAELYGRTCDGGYAKGCYNLGYVYSEGMGVPRDEGRAAQLYQRACDSGDAKGCYNLGYMYSEGMGVPRDEGRAAQLYQRACEAGEAVGCYNLGFLYSNGRGVRQDRAQAAELYGRACDGGDAKGCYNLGYLFSKGEGLPQDQSRAAEFYERACDGGDFTGCTSLGSLHARGEGVPLDRARAAKLHERACEGGHTGACNDLGLLYESGHGVDQDQVRAAELYHRGCESGNTSGCFNLGNLYYEGKGVDQDQARAAELLQRACDGNNMGGCHNLALSYYLGHGVGQDKSVAASLFKRACGNGNQGACEKLERLDWR